MLGSRQRTPKLFCAHKRQKQIQNYLNTIYGEPKKGVLPQNIQDIEVEMMIFGGKAIYEVILRVRLTIWMVMV